jgi:acyl-CoA thioester hydrolase
MARSDFGFAHRFRVRFSEVDPQSVVFNSRYLEYADLAIVEYWRALGFRPGGQDGPDFHVGRATVTYRRPIRMDEEVDALVRVARFGTASMAYLIQLHGAGVEDLRAEIELVYVCVDLASGRSQPIPDDFKARFGQFEAVPA